MDSSQIITLILVSFCVLFSNADEQINKSRANVRKNFIKAQGTFRGGRSGIRRQNGRQILAKRKTADSNDDSTSDPVDPVLLKDLYRMFKEVQENADSEVDKDGEGSPTSKNNEEVQQIQSGSHRFAIPGIRQPTNQRSIGRRKDNEKNVQKVPRFPQTGRRRKLVKESKKIVKLENEGQQSNLEAQHIKSNLSLRPKITGRTGQYSKISKQNKKPSNVHIRIKPKINHLSGRVFPTKKTFSKDVITEDIQPPKPIKKKKKVSLPETPRISNFEGVHSALFGKRLPLFFETLSKTGRPTIKIDLLENPIQAPVQHILPVKRKRPKGINASKTKTENTSGEDNIHTQIEPVIEEQKVTQKQKKYSKKISKEKMMKLSETNRQNIKRVHKKVSANLEKPIESSRATGRQRESLGRRKFIDPRKNSVEETLTIGARHSSDQTILELGNKQDNIFKRRKFTRKNIIPAAETAIGIDKLMKSGIKTEENGFPMQHVGIKNNILLKRIKPLDQRKPPVQEGELNVPIQADTFLKRRKSLEVGIGQSKSEEFNQNRSSLEKTRLAVGQINSRKFRKGIRKNTEPSNKRKFSVLKKSSLDSNKTNKPSPSDINKSDFLEIEKSSVKPPIRITLRKHVPSRKIERISNKRRGTKIPKLIDIGDDKENDDNSEIYNIIDDSNDRKTLPQFRRRKPVLNNGQQRSDNNSENKDILDTNTNIKRSRSQSVPELEVINAQTGPRQHQVKRKQLSGKKHQGQQESISLKESSHQREHIQNESNASKVRKTSEQFVRQFVTHASCYPFTYKKGVKDIECVSITDKVVKQPESAALQENLKNKTKIQSATRQKHLKVKTKVQSEDLVDGRFETQKLNHVNLPNVIPFTAFNWQLNDEKNNSKGNDSLKDITINKILDHSKEMLNKRKENNSFKAKNHLKSRQRNIKKDSKDITMETQKVLSEQSVRIKESNLPRKTVPRGTVTNEEDLVSRNGLSTDTFNTRQSQFSTNTSARLKLQNDKQLTSRNFVPVVFQRTKENNLSRNTPPRPTLRTNIQRSSLNNKDNLITRNNPPATTLKTKQPSPTTTLRSTHGSRKYSFARTNTQRNIQNTKQHSIARNIFPSTTTTTEKTVEPNLSRNNIPRTTLVIKEPTFSRTNIVKDIIKTLSPKDNSRGRNQPPTTTFKTTQFNLSRQTTQETTSKVKESIFTTKDIEIAEKPNVLGDSTPVIIGTTEIYHLPIIKQNEFSDELFGSPTEITPYSVDIALKHAEDTWKQDPYREEIEETQDILFDIDYSKDPDPSYDNTEAASSFVSEIENESKLSVTAQPVEHINNVKPSNEKTDTSVQERRQSRRNGKIGHIKHTKTLTSEIRNQQINIPGIEGKPLMDQIFILEEFGSSSFNKNRARGKRNPKEDVSNISKDNMFAEDKSWIIKYN